MKHRFNEIEGQVEGRIDLMDKKVCQDILNLAENMQEAQREWECDQYQLL